MSITVSRLQALLTGAAMRISPVRFEVDGREVEFVGVRLHCREAPDGGRPAEVPTVVLTLTRGVGEGAAVQRCGSESAPRPQSESPNE